MVYCGVALKDVGDVRKMLQVGDSKHMQLGDRGRR